MTNEEYINQIIEIGNTLQIHPNSPKGQTLKKCIEVLSVEDSDYDKLMTINQQLAFENEELRENIEKAKAEIAKPIQEECCYIGEAKIQADTIKWCLEILDNIGKADIRTNRKK